jgi:prepilin-type N-terminal cleavage/methylation domain-containing protein
MKHFKNKHAGFSLIELIMVLIILSVVMINVYVNWPGATLNVRGQADRLADDIRYTQTLSMSQGQRFRLVKTSSTTYQITNSAGTAIIMPSGGTSVTLGTGISFGALTNLPNSLIAFDGKGAPYTDTGSPGTALASTASILLNSGSESNTISISPETGRVIVQ